jgi:hypothetical protein
MSATLLTPLLRIERPYAKLMRDASHNGNMEFGKMTGRPFKVAVLSNAIGVCRRVTISISMISIQGNFHADRR